MASSVPEDLQTSDITLFTKSDEMTVFVKEASGCAVVDSACSRTVCGVTWLADYLYKLTPMMNKSIKIHRKFCQVQIRRWRTSEIIALCKNSYKDRR